MKLLSVICVKKVDWKKSSKKSDAVCISKTDRISQALYA